MCTSSIDDFLRDLSSHCHRMNNAIQHFATQGILQVITDNKIEDSSTRTGDMHLCYSTCIQ